MAARAFVQDHKKSTLYPARDGNSNKERTHRQQLDHVKRKLLKFLDDKQQKETKGNILPMHVTPSPAPHRIPKRMFNERPNAWPVSTTPIMERRNMGHAQMPLAVQQRMPHLALATPVIARRNGKHGFSPKVDRFSPKIVFF
jgi:hypothetical protein